MSVERIRTLISSLSKEIATEVAAGNLDHEAIHKLRHFEVEVDRIIAEDNPTSEDDSLLEKTKRLEVMFAQKHPVAEGTLREILDTLGKMGI